MTPETTLIFTIGGLVKFIAILSTLIAIPVALLLKRSGRNPAWALLCYIPALGIIGLWVLALTGRKAAAA